MRSLLHPTFSKNHDRLLGHDVLLFLFNGTVRTARERGYFSGEHFSVDGTLIRAWARHKRFVPKASPDDDARLLTNRPRRMTIASALLGRHRGQWLLNIQIRPQALLGAATETTAVD